MIRVALKPDLLEWTRKRASLLPSALGSRFPKPEVWKRGDSYNDENACVGVLFAIHVWASVERCVDFKEAYDLTGLRGGSFQESEQSLGFDLP